MFSDQPCRTASMQFSPETAIRAPSTKSSLTMAQCFKRVDHNYYMGVSMEIRIPGNLSNGWK